MNLTFKKAYHNFTNNINFGNINVKKLDLNSILDTVGKDFLEVKISGIDRDNPECDMLLFEYGNYDWTGEGEKFNLSVKRQIFLSNFEECGYYGFTIYFDKILVGEVEDFSKWCENKNEFNIWLSEIKKTAGIKKINNKPAIRFEIELNKPN
tara:strand:- start:101 stop:556 length:456 start_codon:yes stop_codon:yes gene_type:complete